MTVLLTFLTSLPSLGNLAPVIAANCVDCHMRVQISRSLVFDDEETRVGARVRNQWIRVHPEAKRGPRSR
jgi:hypothetical protein